MQDFCWHVAGDGVSAVNARSQKWPASSRRTSVEEIMLGPHGANAHRHHNTHTHTHPHTLSLSSSPRHEGRNRAHGPGRPVNYFRGCESKVEAAGWKRNLGILDCNGQSASQLVEESLDDLCSACFGFHGHGLGGVSVSGGSHRHIQGNGHTPTPERAQSD